MIFMFYMFVVGDVGLKFMIFGVMNFGVLNRIWRLLEGLNFCVKLKLMILIMLFFCVRYNIFFGCKERVVVLFIFEVIC